MSAGHLDMKSTFHRNVVKTVRAMFKVFYWTLPLTLFGYVIMLFGDDKIGQTVHVDELKDYRIKHTNIHSSFTFEGYHIATVYKKAFLIEYPIQEFELGKYGEYGFNSYTLFHDGVRIIQHTFEYDEASNSLILLSYQYGKYVKSKTFESP